MKIKNLFFQLKNRRDLEINTGTEKWAFLRCLEKTLVKKMRSRVINVARLLRITKIVQIDIIVMSAIQKYSINNVEARQMKDEKYPIDEDERSRKRLRRRRIEEEKFEETHKEEKKRIQKDKNLDQEEDEEKEEEDEYAEYSKKEM